MVDFYAEKDHKRIISGRNEYSSEIQEARLIIAFTSNP